MNKKRNLKENKGNILKAITVTSLVDTWNSLNLKSTLADIINPLIDTNFNTIQDAINDAAPALGFNYKGTFDATTGAFPTGAITGDLYHVSVGGTIGDQTLSEGDGIIYNSDDDTWSIIPELFVIAAYDPETANQDLIIQTIPAAPTAEELIKGISLAAFDSQRAQTSNDDDLLLVNGIIVDEKISASLEGEEYSGAGGNYTIPAGQYLTILNNTSAGSPLTVSLPSSISPNVFARNYRLILREGSGTITVSASGSDTVNTAVSVNLGSSFTDFIIPTGSTNWQASI